MQLKEYDVVVLGAGSAGIAAAVAAACTTSSDSRTIDACPLLRRASICAVVTSSIDRCENQVAPPIAAATTIDVARTSLSEIDSPARA